MGGDGIVNHGVEGLVIDAHNEEEWISAIRKIFTDAEYRKTLSGNAYDNSDKYLWKNVGSLRSKSLRAALAKC
jgi:glycosyltransferase involved in cell wall biosynthesis